MPRTGAPRAAISRDVLPAIERVVAGAAVLNQPLRLELGRWRHGRDVAVCDGENHSKAWRGQSMITGLATISQMIAITAAKAGKPLQNQARNRRW